MKISKLKEKYKWGWLSHDLNLLQNNNNFVIVLISLVKTSNSFVKRSPG